MASSPTLNAKTIYTQLKNASAKGQLGKTMKRLGGKDVFRIKDELGQGMMHLASSEGNLTFIESLANSKWESAINLEDKDKNDWTPLHCACNSGHLEVVAYLIQKGANVSALTIEDATCLHYFSKISPSGKEVLYTSTLQTILSKISNIDQQNKRAQTALSRVAADGLSRRRILLTELITRGANINLKDSVGETTLHSAVRIGDAELVSLLLEKGADITIKGENGTCRSIALAGQHQKIVEILEQWAKDHDIVLDSIEGKSSEKLALTSSFMKLAAAERGNHAADTPRTREFKNAIRRKNIITELMDTERQYVRHLKDLVEVFREPLIRELSSMQYPFMTVGEAKFVFAGELTVLAKFHDGLMASLRGRCRKMDASTTVGDVFQRLADHISTYKAYAESFEAGLDVLRRMLQQCLNAPAITPVSTDVLPTNAIPPPPGNPGMALDWIAGRASRRAHRQSVAMSSGLGGLLAFPGGGAIGNGGGGLIGAAFMNNPATTAASMHTRVEGLKDLIHILSAPLYRISRYTLLSRDLLKATPEGHPDREGTVGFADVVKKVAEAILEAKAAVDNRAKIQQIAESLAGFPEALVVPERRFIREGTMQYRTIAWSSGRAKTQSSWVQGQVFLFNDMMLWTKKSTGERPVRALQFVRGLALQNVVHMGSSDAADGKNAFEIFVEKGTDSIVMQVESDELRLSWISSIAAAVSRQAPNQLWIKPKMKGAAPYQRAGHSASIIRDAMYIFGGNYRNTFFNDLFKFTSDGHVWSRIPASGSVPTERSEHAATAVGENLIVFGGFTGQTRLNDLYLFNTATSTWQVVESHPSSHEPPRPRSGHRMVTYQNRVYLFGGIDSTGNYLNDMYTLMIEGDKALWTLVVAGEDSDPVPEPRAFHSMDVVDGMICIFGGYSFTKCYEGLEYFDPESSKWESKDELDAPVYEVEKSLSSSFSGRLANVLETTPLGPLAQQFSPGDSVLAGDPRPASRYQHSSFVYKNTLFIQGGATFAGKTYFSDLWAVKSQGKDTVQWVRLTMPLQLDSRYNHSIAGPILHSKTNRSQAILFGGQSGTITFSFWNDTAIFKNLDTLVTMALSDEPPKAPIRGRRERATTTSGLSQSTKASPSRSRSTSTIPKNSKVDKSLDSSDDDRKPAYFAMPAPLAAHHSPGTLALTMDVTSDSNFVHHIVIDSVIATTPTATVYRAVYGPVDSPKAPSLVVKIFKSFKYTDKMRREVEAATKLRHPNIVPYYGAADRDGTVWLMSEIELSALPAVSLSCHHTFTEQQMAVIAKSILSAMVYLHSKGQVARYIRPENVLINEDGVVKLAGFGLNLLRHAADAAAGSPRDPAIVAKDSMYLAPEIRGGSAASLKESKSAQSSSEPNAKSDIWAMAVTLIQLSEDRHHASSRPENGGAVSPLSARRNTTSDPDGAGSPSTAPGRSIMLQSRSSLMMNNPFQDFIAKCLLPRADQRSDAASLLKHPFITRFAATQSSDGNASSTVDLHESKEQFPFRDLLFRFKQLRRRRSVNTYQIRTQRIATHDRVNGTNDGFYSPTSPKNLSKQSSLKDERPKLVSKDSRGSNASSSSLESEDEITSELQFLKDELSSLKQLTGDKMSKLEIRLREALEQLQAKETQINALKAQLQTKDEPKREGRAPGSPENNNNSINKRYTVAVQIQNHNAATPSPTSSNGSTPRETTKALNAPEGPAATPALLATSASTNLGAHYVAEPTMLGSPDAVSAPANKKLSLLAALSLEGSGAAAATENHTATTSANAKTAAAEMKVNTLSKASSRFARGESAYSGPVQRPTLLTSSSRILDRIKFFEEAAALAPVDVAQQNKVKQSNDNASAVVGTNSVEMDHNDN